MTQDTRERVKQQYSRSGKEYDQVRLVNPRGRLLSDYDVNLFLSMLPELDSVDRILEVGAGTGRFTIPMIERGYRLIASDINETMLDELRAKLEARGQPKVCEVRVEDIFHLSVPDATFDFVFSLHVIPRLNSLSDQSEAIAEVARTIKPGGHFLFNYRNRCSLLYGSLYRGHAATPHEIGEILHEHNLRIMLQRGKMLLNRTLINRLPLFAGRAIASCDSRLTRWCTSRAWDVFVLARKGNYNKD